MGRRISPTHLSRETRFSGSCFHAPDSAEFPSSSTSAYPPHRYGLHMQLIQGFADLIAELDRVHPDGGVDAKAWSLNDDNSLPSFVVAENGLERFFTRAASTALKHFAEIRYENDAGLSSKITLPRFMEIEPRRLLRRLFCVSQSTMA
jgi:hypothetical protein